MNVQMGPADLTILNPMLKPLASAELRSGLLDSMTMQVTGREAFAVGDMKMVYHDFKINVINNVEDILKLDLTLEEFNYKIIQHYLDKNNKNVISTAKKLGIGKSTIYRMIQEGHVIA